MKQWIPKLIQKNLAYKSQEVVTAADYNAILNLLITQGDYNSEWLEWLTHDGFTEFFKDLNGEDIKQMVVQAAGEQLATLAAASANKTSAYLNNPTFTFLDESATTSVRELFKEILDEYGVVGTASCYTSLVGAGNPHMDLTDLQALQVDGYAVINHGTTKEALTDETVLSVLTESRNYMMNNGISTGYNIFAYNNKEEPSETVRDEVSKLFTNAIGNTTGVNDTDAYDTGWLLVVPITAGEDIIREAVAETIRSNRWCIFKCDSSSSDFTEVCAPLLRLAIESALEDANTLITTVPVAVNLAAHTLNNKIKNLQQQTDALTQEVAAIKDLLKKHRNITHGRVSDGLPPVGNEGDIHIMYE